MEGAARTAWPGQGASPPSTLRQPPSGLRGRAGGRLPDHTSAARHPQPGGGEEGLGLTPGNPRSSGADTRGGILGTPSPATSVLLRLPTTRDAAGRLPARPALRSVRGAPLPPRGREGHRPLPRAQLPGPAA
nr:translation initiation factor IF-2-like [Pongo abelii]XP_054351515.1 translation initiation factor IF-2-like [Pongo pygmaeus]